MEDGADHLAHDVFPRVPVRQWVLSFPRRLRFLAARDPRVATRLLDVFTRVLFAWQRRRARALGAADPRTAGVTAAQRFGSAVNLNVHFHSLLPDGVFVLEGSGPARFVPVAPPKDEEVEALLAAVIRKVARLGLLASGDERAGADEDAFAALQAAEVDRRLSLPDPVRHARRSAHLEGFSLHAGVRVHANDRDRLERLCRYALRPPLALHRLSQGPDGRLVYRMKRPRGGSLFLLLTPDEMLARLAKLVPPPRSHALRYHGLFAPNSKHRARVVPAGAAARLPTAPAAPEGAEWEPPAATPPTGDPRPAPAPGYRREPLDPPPDRPLPRTRVPWAELLRKVFAIDVLEYPGCMGRLEVVAFIAEETVARRILDHLGYASRAPPLAPARPPGEEHAGEPAPDHDGIDPIPSYE